MVKLAVFGEVLREVTVCRDPRHFLGEGLIVGLAHQEFSLCRKYFPDLVDWWKGDGTEFLADVLHSFLDT